MSVFEIAFNQAWAMDPQMVEQVFSVIQRQGPWRREVGAEGAHDFRLADYPEFERLSKAKYVSGEPLQGAHRATVTVASDGSKVATLPVMGPLSRRANMATELSGATSYDMVSADLKLALADPTVKAIVLAIDSPGGTVSGNHELAREVRAAASIKPVEAVGMGVMASAAYFIGSAASRITVEAASVVGSIGTITQAVREENKGEITFVSSQSPLKNADPSTKEGASHIQQMVDDMAQVFVSSVAEFRGVSVEKVLSDFGCGGVMVGSKAVKAGMVDEVGTLDSVIARLLNEAPKVNSGGGSGAVAAENYDMNLKQFLGILSPEEKAAAKRELEQEEAANAGAAPGDAAALNAAQLAEIENLRQQVNALSEKLSQADDKAKSAEEIAAEANEDALRKEAGAFAANLVKNGVVLAAKAQEVAATYFNLGGMADASALDSYKNAFAISLEAAKASGTAHAPGKEAVADFVFSAEEDQRLNELFVLPDTNAGSEKLYDEDALVAQFNARRGHGS